MALLMPQPVQSTCAKKKTARTRQVEFADRLVPPRPPLPSFVIPASRGTVVAWSALAGPS